MPSSRVTSEIRRLQLPADVGFTIVGANGQSGDLQQWNNNSGTVLARVTSAGLASFPNVAVTATTIPTNGIYLPAANTLGLATNGGSRLQIDSLGNIGANTTPVTTVGLYLAKGITGGTTAYGIYNVQTIASDVTVAAYGIISGLSTAAASFTIPSLFHFAVSPGSFRLGSAVTNQYGFFVDTNLTGATNNYGFYGNIASGSNRWNFYASGTAANYFAGQTTVGSTSLTLGASSVAQQFGVVAGAATTVGAVIRGAASQTADLQQWQNSSGTVLTAIGSGGALTIHGVTSTGATGTGKMVFDTTPTLVTPVIGAATGTSLAVTGAVTSSSATSGIGYATGAGGTQTQSGGKTTGVTLNTITGQITMSTGNLTAGSITSFTLTNSAVATTDVVHVQHISGGTVGAYTCTAAPGNGSATIYVRNSSGSNLNEQPVLQFVVIKAVTA